MTPGRREICLPLRSGGEGPAGEDTFWRNRIIKK